MGLAGRKVKQRIPNDPRNLSWADDAARFGSNYLAKFGWDASKGLGAEGEGRLSHIKVTQKLDMMGIGAAHQMDPNGIAWKQNKDFENLLRRLNEGSGDADVGTGAGGTKVEGFKRADEGKKEEEKEDVGGEAGEVKSAEGEKKKKKRKDKEGGEDDSERKKKRKKEKEEAIESEKTEVVVVESTAMDVDKAVEDKSVAVVEVKRPVVPRHRAHRARAIAAKNISSKSAAHISEILGVAPTPSSFSSTPTPAPDVQNQGKLTSLTDPSDTQLELEKITTSTKSLADYFKEKLAAKSSGSATPSSAAASPRTPVDDYIGKEEDDYDTPRMGLGGLGFSRAKVEVQSETVKVEEATQRMGMSRFSALMSSSFLAATSLPSSFPSEGGQEDEKKDSSDDEEAEESVKSKKEKKEKRKKEKKVKESAEEEAGQVMEKTEKKKKDKKGKDKAVDPEPAVEESVAEEADDKTEKKKKKKDKDKRRKAAESADEETPAKANESAPEDVEPKKKKEKKRKSKSEDSEAALAAEVEVEKKPRKEKKKKHRTSDEDS